MSRPTKRTIAVLALAGVLGWLVASKFTSSEGEATSRGGEQETEASLVTTHTVEPSPMVDTISTVGTLKAAETLEIRNEVPGKVTRIGFEEGERVERGDLLLQIRDDSVRARLAVKQRRKDLLQTEVERNRKVLEKGGISQQEFDVKENELEVLKAEIDEVRAELQKASVRAPFDGVVGLRDVSTGAVLTTGTRVATLSQFDPIEIEFTIPERYAGRIDKDTVVKFRTHASDEIREAEVFAFEPQLDADNRTLVVRARTTNEDNELRPGAYAQVRTVVERKERVLAVPATAVVTSSQANHIWVNAGGKAKKREVELGMRTENRVEVTDGLSAGDTVITTGRQALKPGAELKVDESEDAMNVDEIAPDPSRGGMRNEWFSEEPLEESPGGEEEDNTDPVGESGEESVGEEGDNR